jgi:hypothetical protein
MHRPRLIVALLALVILAACAQTAAPTEGEAATPTETETPSPTPSPEPTEEAAETEDVGPLPSFDLQGDPELAGRFPDTVGGQPLEMASMRGDTFLSAGADADPAFEEFLDRVGAELSDVSVAFGGVASETGEFLQAGAFRVLGVSQDDLEREFIAASEREGDISAFEQSSVAGKDVWTATQEGTSVVLYAKDDTIYYLTGDAALAEEVLAELP